MFNKKLKQQITDLQQANKSLQVQYDNIYRLLQERQDEVIQLQRHINQSPKLDREDVESILSEVINNQVNNDYEFVKQSLNEQFVDTVIDKILEQLFDE